MRLLILSLILLPLGTAVAGETPELTATAPSDQGRVEVGLVPIAGQLNGGVNAQTSGGLFAAWYLRDGFALSTRYSHRLWSGLTAEGEIAAMDPHDDMKRVDPWHEWSLMAGTELTPTLGTGSWGSVPMGISLVLGGHLGVVSTRDAILGSGSMFMPEDGLDTGLHPAAGFSVGGRMRLGRYFALRAELTSVLSSGNVTTVAGCSEDELETIRSTQSGAPAVSSRCDVKALNDGDYAGLALNSIRGSRANGPIHTFSAQIGAAFVF